MNDSELERLAQRLGARAAAGLDVERTADAVVQRLRAAPRLTGAAWIGARPAWLKIAAAVALVLGAGLGTRAVVRWPFPPVAARAIVADYLSDLTVEQLRDVASALDQPLSAEQLGAGDAELEGLTADELRALLSTLEG